MSKDYKDPRTIFENTINLNCNNANDILNDTYIEGNHYSLIKSNLYNEKYTCTVIDATFNNSEIIDYSLFDNISVKNKDLDSDEITLRKIFTSGNSILIKDETAESKAKTFFQKNNNNSEENN